MKPHLVVIAILTVVVAQATAGPTIRPKPKREATEAKGRYRHLLLRPGQSVGSIGPKEAVLRAVSAQEGQEFGISAAQQMHLDRVVGHIKQKPDDLEGIGREWTRFVKSLANHSKPVDLSALMDHTVRTSMLESNGDLRFFAARAERLKCDMAGTKRLLAELMRLKRKIRDNPAVFEQVTAQMLDAEITKWRAKLTMIRADAQLANVDLQNSMQKQSQAVNMMSSILKTMRDRASAITKNVR